ncbi:hypothetical protein BHM03_00047491, partial [Ensete ventricosum]
GHYHLFAIEKTLTLTALVLTIVTIVITPTQTTVLRTDGGYHSPRAIAPMGGRHRLMRPPGPQAAHLRVLCLQALPTLAITPVGGLATGDHPCRWPSHPCRQPARRWPPLAHRQRYLHY